MNLLQAIAQAHRAIRRLRPIAGYGIHLDVTPHGTVISATARAASASSPKGMFHILPDDTRKPEEGRLHYLVADDHDAARATAGVAHVNNQPFTVAAFRRTADAPEFILLRFTDETTDAEGHAVPAVCDIVALPNSPESTPDVSYHLIGRIVRDAGGGLAIAQDHAPGNLYHLWFGPCFHLLQTPPTA